MTLPSRFHFISGYTTVFLLSTNITTAVRWGQQENIFIYAQYASLNRQDHLHNIEKWFQKWKMKANETKSSHITFTLRKGQCPPVCINQTAIPQVETVKYLGLHFDRKLTWIKHTVKKRKQLDHKTREIKWLIGKKHLPYH